MSTPVDESPPDEPQAAGGDGAPSTPPGSPRFAREVRAHIKRWLKKPPDTSQRLWTCLLITLVVDFIAAFALAIGEFIVARAQTFGFFAALGAGVLIVIALANLWALISVGRGAQSWARDAFIAQLFVFVLALYIAWLSFQSAPLNWRALTLAAVALTLCLVALVWLLLLFGRAALQWKAAAILGALVPIVGATQFWLQNFYIPQTTAPLIDFSANLSAQGHGGSATHLSAKVTVRNRGAVTVRVAGALMRVTAYAKEASPQSQDVPRECEGWNGSYDSKCVQKFLDLSGNSYDRDFRVDRDYRVDPTLAKNAKPVYTGLLMPGPHYALNPGDTQYFQREIDINSNVRLVRLAASAVFLTNRTISEVRSCADPNDPNSKPVSLDSHPREFRGKVNTPILLPLDPERSKLVLCKDYEIARASIVDELIGHRPVIQVTVILVDPDHGELEHPQLGITYSLADTDKVSTQDINKIAAANPAAVYKDVSVECVYEACDEKVQAGELPPVTTHGH
jgi:hypothetical protein